MTAVFSLAVTLLMVIVCTWLIWYARHTAQNYADSQLKRTIQTAISEFEESSHAESLSTLIEDEQDEVQGNNLILVVKDRHGNIIGKHQKLERLLPIKSNSSWRIATGYFDDNLLIAGMPWQKTQTELRYHEFALIFFALFIIIVIPAGTWILVGRTLSPIASLSRQANTASVDSLNIVLNRPSDDIEIVELVATLNGLLHRLSETATAKERFYSAASHELRTPLQALLGHLELALSRERSKEEYQKVVEEAYTQARRLIFLVKGLLLLYQLDSPNERPIREPENLSAVCRRVLSHLQPAIERNKLMVSINIPENADILAPPTHIDMLVRNLAENAVKYTSSGCKIKVSVNVSSDKTELTIFNEFSNDVIWVDEHIFEPFSRPDSSRSPHTGGTGLGLAICKAISDANVWMLQLEQNDTGVLATVIIPSAV